MVGVDDFGEGLPVSGIVIQRPCPSSLNVIVVVLKTGWPSDGGDSAAVENARTVTRGTPKTFGQLMETYLFAMFNETQKGSAETQRHFGLCSPN
ncbi:hypothetical protein DVH24_004921 [Malus domestica]|uniref:glucan endo-1,3-beta-D-glucosidase n=1 Tax=Malus domestica TaxID=3750 RepID=A0A498IG92_MALDO|nr:hypothetical protein DVH24_004921 [Malus domestica]